MKSYLFYVTLFVFHIKAFGQTPFEGIIKYNITDKKDSVVLSVDFYFKEGKIMTKATPAIIQPGKAGDFLVDFYKGIIYHFYANEKKYIADTLKSLPLSNNTLFKEAAKTNNSKSILNNKCTLFTYFDAGSKDFVQNTTYDLWFTDSLFYSVEEKYLYLDDLALFVNGKGISLESNISSTILGTAVSINSKAVSIEKKTLNDFQFKIPEDYSFAAGSYYTESDTTNSKVEMADIKLEELKSVPMKLPPSKPKTKTTKKVPKSPASKPKQ